MASTGGSPRQQELIRFLTSRRPQSGAEARRHLGVSQAVFSRLVSSLGNDILVIGKARATRYVGRRQVPGMGDRTTIYEIDETGGSRTAAILHAAGPEGFFVESRVDEVRSAFHDDLPYFLDAMRPAGFLGREIPKLQPELDLPLDVRLWSADQCLKYLTRYGWNLPGSLIVGDEAFRLFLKHGEHPPSVVEAAQRAREYPKLAVHALERGVPGSSAGGEQPKFLTHRAPGPVEVLVKFSPPVSDGTTRRSADLLVAEHIAHETLRANGMATSASELVFAEDRVFLEVERFDRLPHGGRRGVISLWALDAEYAGRMNSWSDSAVRLQKKGVIDEGSVPMIRRLELFGGLIANTDMHPGNLSFFTKGARVTDLAPAYDMLPMRYSPRDGHSTDRDFEPPLPTGEDVLDFPAARRAAMEFWHRVAMDDAISEGFQSIARENEAKLAALEHLERKLPTR